MKVGDKVITRSGQTAEVVFCGQFGKAGVKFDDGGKVVLKGSDYSNKTCANCGILCFPIAGHCQSCRDHFRQYGELPAVHAHIRAREDKQNG